MAEEQKPPENNPQPTPPPEPLAVESVEAPPHVENVGESNLDLLLDVSLNVAVEVGRTRLSVDEILKLAPGSVVRLNRAANEPVELRINGKLVAYGEVVVVNESYAIRLVQIVDPGQRMATLASKK
ncbi:MAG: flagellar motor switch protein FliN [Planctomycetota bacterium]